MGSMNNNKRLLSKQQVIVATGLNAAELEQMVSEGSFPAPLPLGPWNFGWDTQAVDAWAHGRKPKPMTDSD